MYKATILVIDDEQRFLDVITNTLKASNYKVIQALNGEMGVMVALKFMPDIIICDWEMPVMDGIEAIKTLKNDKETKDIPVIMATGAMTTSDDLNTALNAGAVDYIRKPIDPIELIARINSALKLSKSYKEIKEKNIEIVNQYEEILMQNKEIQMQNEEISSQHEMLERANLELEKLSIVASETDNSVIIMDKYGNFEWANSAFKKLHGHSLNDYITKFGNNIIEASNNTKIKETFDYVIAEKKSRIYESSVQKENGEVIWLQTTLSPVLNKKKEIVNLITIDTNINKLKKAENKIKEQNKKLERQNELITDSINYAKTLQEIILPPKSDIDAFFKTFIFFKPKDIVSGDFYWFSAFPEYNEFLIGVIDCTGHGVPGAFMSLIGNNLLTNIIKQKGLRKPQDIIQELDKGIVRVLRQNQSDNMDGMDVIFCRIVLEGNKRKVSFIGSNRPLLCYSKEKKNLEVIKGWSKTIGGVFKFSEDYKYEEKTIFLNKGDILYLSSDGYIDQLNKENTRFGSRSLYKILDKIGSYNFKEQREIIDKELTNQMNGAEQSDDITIIGIEL